MTLPAPKRYRTRREEREAGAEQAREALAQARALEVAATQLLDEAGAPAARPGRQPGKAGDLDRLAPLLLRLAAARAVPGDRARARLLAQARRLLADADRLCWAAVLANDMQVRTAARKYGRHRDTFDDEYQVARLGCHSAARRFRPEKRLQFATYARWWIHAALTRQLPGHELKANTAERLRNIRKAEAEGLSDEGVADRVGCTLEELRSLRLLDHVSYRVSLDGEGVTGQTIAETLEADEPEERTAEADAERAAAAIGRLSQQQRQVLRMRYGIGCEQLTLSQIAGRMSLSRERVRQVEADAIVELRVDLGLIGPEDCRSVAEYGRVARALRRGMRVR